MKAFMSVRKELESLRAKIKELMKFQNKKERYG